MGKSTDFGALPRGEVLIYQAGDGSTRIAVRVEDDTVWLSQQQMADFPDKQIQYQRTHKAYF